MDKKKDISVVFKLLGYKNIIDVMRAIDNGNTRFTKIMFELGVNPNTLKRLLDTLVDLDMVEKTGYGTYKPTNRGRKVLKKVDELKTIFDE